MPGKLYHTRMVDSFHLIEHALRLFVIYHGGPQKFFEAILGQEYLKTGISNGIINTAYSNNTQLD